MVQKILGKSDISKKRKRNTCGWCYLSVPNTSTDLDSSCNYREHIFLFLKIFEIDKDIGQKTDRGGQLVSFYT